MAKAPGWVEFFLDSQGDQKDFDLSDPQSSGHVNRKRRKREGLSNKGLNKGSGQGKKKKTKKKDERPVGGGLVSQLAGEDKKKKKKKRTRSY